MTIARPAGTFVRWPWMAAAACFAQYVLVGVWLLKVKGYTIGDANARTVSAELMVLSSDPHLGAMGFYWQPLPMLIRIPFVLVLHPFGQTILAGPLSSALCIALVVPVLARLGRELGLHTGTTAVLIGLYALNPVTIFSAANGMSEALFSLVVAIALLAFVRFQKSLEVRDLAFLGVTLGVGIATRIEFIPLTFAFAVACVLLVSKELRVRTAAMVFVPPAFVFALWSLASSLIAGDALYWYHTGRVIGGSVTDRPWLPSVLNPVTILGYCGALILMIAPALIVVMTVGATQRRVWRPFLGLALIAVTIPAFVALQLKLNTTTGEPRYFALMPLFGCVLAIWVLARLGSGGQLLRVALHVLIAGLGIAGAVVTTFAYADPVRTEITRDGVFFAAIVGEPPPTYLDYAAALEPMIHRLDDELAKGKRVAMDSHGGTAILFSTHPERFIVPENRDFEQIMADPTGRFEYVILITVLTGAPNENIKSAMTKVEGGHFEMVEDDGPAQLWRFVADAQP